MNYAEAIAHLHSLGQELAPPTNPSASRRKFDLQHMRVLAQALGNPQKTFHSILIGGTNGKGSTAATLASILTVAGYSTGLYTSPHLSKVNERIQVTRATLPPEYGSVGTLGTQGSLALLAIPDNDFAATYSRVRFVADGLVRDRSLPFAPSFFEMLTAAAFAWFAESRVEIVVLEVGLGGRLDATNIVEPLISILTDISLDHQDYLGSTLTEIATEKCGILRKHGTLITLPQHPEVNESIGAVATQSQVYAIDAAKYLPYLRNDRGPFHSSDNSTTKLSHESSRVTWPTFPEALRNRYEVGLEDGLPNLAIDSPLSGQHQQRNIALAIAATIQLRSQLGFQVSNEAITNGIRSTVWPGRLEFVNPNMLLDVAHNPAGAWTLRAAIADLPEERPRTLIFSCLQDKDLREMSRILFPLFDSSPDGDPHRRLDHLVLAAINNPRATSMVDLVAAAVSLGVPAYAAANAADALEKAQALTPAEGLIIATGSVYLVGELRELSVQRDAVKQDH